MTAWTSDSCGTIAIKTRRSTRFTRVPIKTKTGCDKVYVMSCGPTVMQYTNGRAQDYIDITQDELDRITEAVKD